MCQEATWRQSSNKMCVVCVCDYQKKSKTIFERIIIYNKKREKNHRSWTHALIPFKRQFALWYLGDFYFIPLPLPTREYFTAFIEASNFKCSSRQKIKIAKIGLMCDI